MISEETWQRIKTNELQGMIGKLMTRVEALETKTKELQEAITCKKQN